MTEEEYADLRKWVRFEFGTQRGIVLSVKEEKRTANSIRRYIDERSRNANA